MCLGVVAAVTACVEPEPSDLDDVETGETESALLANPTIPRGATWTYWDRGAPDQSWWGADYYDDSAWSSGAAPLGYGESYIRTNVGYGGNASNKHITTYFRYSFDVADPDRVGKILAEVMFDDAFAVRINDIQIAYDGFPAGWNTFSHTTLGVGREANNSYKSYDLTTARRYLRRGTNTIAVEVHQSDASSSDLVFDLSLALEEITLAPGVAVPRRSPVWEYADSYMSRDNDPQWPTVQGDTFGWSVGGAPLGYGETYLATTIRKPTETWQSPTTYYRHHFQIDDPTAVSELRGELMYDDGAVVYLNGTRIDALSMPPGDESHAALAFDHEAGNAYVGRDWTAFRSYLREGDNVIGVALHQNSRASSDAVFDLSLSYRTTPPVTVPTEDIARGAVWTYWDRGGDLGTGWRAPSFDDASWRRGPGPLGYGESYLGTTVEYGPDANNKYRTTYFRNRFRVADRTAVTSLVADVMYDDGAVIYLNGTEVKRLSMPAGAITATTLASGHEGGTYERHDLGAARNLLVDGDNVITVEVHQNSASSSDLAFDLALDVSTGPGNPPPPPAAPGIARGSSWRYWASPSGFNDQRWTDDTDNFADDQWPLAPGPLGYGESYIRSNISYGPDPARKYMTTYFRNSFVIEDPARVTSLVTELMYDDGIIVYLNGNEVVRRSMPSGNVEHATPAIWHEANNTYETVDLTAARQHLVPGRNWVAVRVHQDVPGSSDLVFDLALRFETSASTPTISRRAPWLYYDRGPLAAGWQTSTDTTGWDGGDAPFGYNHGGERTGIGYDWAHDTERRPRTTYFRRHFNVASASAVTELRGELRVDDGAIVYLNGHEVQRLAMPAGAVTFDTAAAHHDGTTYEAFDWSAAIGRLRTGENVLAIEVHQEAADVGDAADLIFDASLEVITAATPRIAGCTPTTPTPGGGLTGVWIAPGGVVWASGGDGMIGRRNLNAVWAWCRVSSSRSYGAVWGSGDNDVWFAGNSGELERWNGSGFTTVDTGSDAGIGDVWGTGPTNVFVVGGGGLARRFDGNTWHVHDVALRGPFAAVWGASAGDIWAVGQELTPGATDYEDLCESIIYRWNPATASFFREHDFDQYYGGCGFEGISGTGPDDVWAVGEQYPAGAATGYGMAANNTGGTWHKFQPSLDIEEEYLIADRLYTDVAVHPTGNAQGVWITAVGETAIRWDGTAWSEGPANSEHLTSIDHRGMQMFAVGYPNKVLRWNGTTWVQER